SPKEIRCRHDRSVRWRTCDTGRNPHCPVRPSHVLVARIAARHPPPTAASLLRTVRVAWTRRSNEGGPAGCPLEDPSFATIVSTCSPMRKGAIAPLIHRPRSRNGERGHAPHLISPGGAFRRAGNPVCFDREHRQWGA
ncbi:hypothetical protein, partial [Acetobacter oeni]|uniref:hypothetical protein n=1 Tax=Acetobacter oeni TaxID=304077 RepID=UPI001C990CDC